MTFLIKYWYNFNSVRWCKNNPTVTGTTTQKNVLHFNTNERIKFILLPLLVSLWRQATSSFYKVNLSLVTDFCSTVLLVNSSSAYLFRLMWPNVRTFQASLAFFIRTSNIIHNITSGALQMKWFSKAFFYYTLVYIKILKNISQNGSFQIDWAII